jgi:preprotein translocase subunit SecD
MSRIIPKLCGLLFIAPSIGCSAGGSTGEAPKVPDGVYLVLRANDSKEALTPPGPAERLLVDHHRYQPEPSSEPPNYLVVSSDSKIALQLAAKPKADREGEEVVRIFLQLQPKPAKQLEELTAAHSGKQLAIVLGGEVVTVHKIREKIAGGAVLITSCTKGAANYLLDQLQKLQE